MYIDDRTRSAIAAMRKAGLDDSAGASAFGKRVFTCVVRLLKEFFAQTHTPFSSEFALGLFNRLARGEPITADFLMGQKRRLEAVARNNENKPSEKAEEDAWLADRYGMTPQQAALVIKPMRRDAAKDSYGFPKNDDIMAQPWFNLDEYGADASARLDILRPIAESSVPQDDIEDEGCAPSKSEEEKKDMCLPNTDLVRAVRGVVEELCDDLTSFTAVDVSNAVKRAGHARRHREIAPIVREMYSDGEMEGFGYTRELITVSLPGGRSAQAWLYHHQTSDPADYDTRAQVALPPAAATQPQQTQKPLPAPPPPPPTPQVLVTPPSAPPVPQGTVVTGTTKASSRGSRMLNTATASRTQKLDGRLEIPRGWIRKLGWTEGDEVKAVQQGGAILLKPASNVLSHEEVVYTFVVDRWNRIRVTNRALTKVGLNTGGSHTVTLQTDSIKVG